MDHIVSWLIKDIERILSINPCCNIRRFTYRLQREHYVKYVKILTFSNPYFPVNIPYIHTNFLFSLDLQSSARYPLRQVFSLLYYGKYMWHK